MPRIREERCAEDLPIVQSVMKLRLAENWKLGAYVPFYREYARENGNPSNEILQNRDYVTQTAARMEGRSAGVQSPAMFKLLNAFEILHVEPHRRIPGVKKRGTYGFLLHLAP